MMQRGFETTDAAAEGAINTLLHHILSIHTTSSHPINTHHFITPYQYTPLHHTLSVHATSSHPINTHHFITPNQYTPLHYTLSIHTTTFELLWLTRQQKVRWVFTMVFTMAIVEMITLSYLKTAHVCSVTFTHFCTYLIALTLKVWWVRRLWRCG